MRSDNLQLPCVQPPTSLCTTFNFRINTITETFKHMGRYFATTSRATGQTGDKKLTESQKYTLRNRGVKSFPSIRYRQDRQKRLNHWKALVFHTLLIISTFDSCDKFQLCQLATNPRGGRPGATLAFNWIFIVFCRRNRSVLKSVEFAKCQLAVF